ncbi:hypothetical protein BGZ76_011307 [Entomortierella beljakovae]|nr:hypothetical protein BGZ76_011307 [Entomortierella beljakovae]
MDNILSPTSDQDHSAPLISPSTTSTTTATETSTSTSTSTSFTGHRANRGPPSYSSQQQTQSQRAYSHLYPVSQESITDYRLFDGVNSPQNIAVYGFGLGALFGASVILSSMVETNTPQLWIFLAALGVFHALEYIAIALFNPTKLKLDSFLLNHSPEYTLATASGVSEFLIEYYFFPQFKSFGYINKIGFILVIMGQVARTLAMFCAKSNFSHNVEYYREEHHVLVTNGIYSILRHPSYFGFYYWALGSQIMLMNPICMIGFAGALYYFFSERIQHEEQLLVRFFGQDYRDYRDRTRTGLPFIK